MNEFVIDFPGGARVDAHFGPYTVKTDQPPSGGGEGSAPAPFSLFLASVGTCAGIYVLGFCQQRGIQTDGSVPFLRRRASPRASPSGCMSMTFLARPKPGPPSVGPGSGSPNRNVAVARAETQSPQRRRLVSRARRAEGARRSRISQSRNTFCISAPLRLCARNVWAESAQRAGISALDRVRNGAA